MKLRDRLKQLGLSQKKFAANLGVSEASVSSWISRRTVPDMRRIPLIEHATGGAVTLADFLDDDATSVARKDNSIQGSVSKRQPVTTRTAGLAEAQAPFAAAAAELGLDASAIAAQAVRAAIGDERARRWNEENRESIAAHNRYVEEYGLPLEKHRMF